MRDGSPQPMTSSLAGPRGGGRVESEDGVNVLSSEDSE